MTQDEWQELMRRFDSFNDGVIRSVLIKGPFEQRATITVVLDAQDCDTPGFQWVAVELEFKLAGDFRIWHHNDNILSVISFGVDARWHDGYVYVDFQPNDPTDLARPLDELRQSDFFVSARELTWSVKE